MLAEKVIFQHRLVRDLAWVISSPPLFEAPITTPKNNRDSHWWSLQDCQKEYLDCLPELLALDLDPSPLITHLAQLKSKGLGHYFEAFVAFWIKISPNYRLLERNLQIIIEGHTYGEIDFIIEEKNSKKVIHLEVAIKFYLGNAPYDNPFRWFGTNTNDQLGKKTTHLAEQQTQISKKHPDYLKQRGYEVNERHCFLKGRLFYPQGFDIPPCGATSSHLRGRWVQGDLNEAEALYYPVDKIDYLSKIYPVDINKQLVQNRLTEAKWPRCYVKLRNDCNNQLSESQRIFHLEKSFIFPMLT